MNTLTLLLVEDDENDTLLFSTCLDSAGETTQMPLRLGTVRNGEEATDYLSGKGTFANREAHPFPDLLVTDLKMPRMSGFDLLAWLRGRKQYATLPRIILTASNNEEDYWRAYELGANTCFKKPMGMGPLRQLLCDLVRYWSHVEKELVQRQKK